GYRSVKEHTVLTGDFLGDVGDHRVLKVADAAASRFGVLPGDMAVNVVHGNGDHLGVQRFEFRQGFAESEKLGGADERKVGRIKEQQNIFAFIIRKFEFADAAVRHGRLSSEIRGLASDECTGTFLHDIS